MLPEINAVIIVEGKDDITAVKKAVNAQVIAVNGFSVNKKSTIERIKTISKNKDIIILTDPDHAGKIIRQTISKNIPNAKHAFISRNNGKKQDNIGVENATPDVILDSIKKAKVKFESIENVFNIDDLIDNDLLSGKNSRYNREKLGDLLKIGYFNAKQLLKNLNNFGITREDFQKAIDEIKNSR